jgi:hypothetical protein
MDEQQLQRMYQAWQQGIKDPARDWDIFVELAAKQLNISGDKIIKILQRCHWFDWREK